MATNEEFIDSLIDLSLDARKAFDKQDFDKLSSLLDDIADDSNRLQEQIADKVSDTV